MRVLVTLFMFAHCSDPCGLVPPSRSDDLPVYSSTPVSSRFFLRWHAPCRIRALKLTSDDRRFRVRRARLRSVRGLAFRCSRVSKQTPISQVN